MLMSGIFFFEVHCLVKFLLKMTKLNKTSSFKDQQDVIQVKLHNEPGKPPTIQLYLYILLFATNFLRCSYNTTSVMIHCAFNVLA